MNSAFSPSTYKSLNLLSLNEALLLPLHEHIHYMRTLCLPASAISKPHHPTPTPWREPGKLCNLIHVGVKAEFTLSLHGGMKRKKQPVRKSERASEREEMGRMMEGVEVKRKLENNLPFSSKLVPCWLSVKLEAKIMVAKVALRMMLSSSSRITMALQMKQIIPMNVRRYLQCGKRGISISSCQDQWLEDVPANNESALLMALANQSLLPSMLEDQLFSGSFHRRLLD